MNAPTNIEIQLARNLIKKKHREREGALGGSYYCELRVGGMGREGLQHAQTCTAASALRHGLTSD